MISPAIHATCIYILSVYIILIYLFFEVIIKTYQNLYK